MKIKFMDLLDNDGYLYSVFYTNGNDEFETFYPTVDECRKYKASNEEIHQYDVSSYVGYCEDYSDDEWTELSFDKKCGNYILDGYNIVK